MFDILYHVDYNVSTVNVRNLRDIVNYHCTICHVGRENKMAKIYSYQNHSEMNAEDYNYIASVACDNPENIPIEEVNEFLNELADYNAEFAADEYFMDEFDYCDTTQMKKELGL